MNQPGKKSGCGNRGKTNYVFPPFPQPLLLLTNQDEKAAHQNKRRSFTQNPLRILVATDTGQLWHSARSTQALSLWLFHKMVQLLYMEPVRVESYVTCIAQIMKP